MHWLGKISLSLGLLIFVFLQSDLESVRHDVVLDSFPASLNLGFDITT